jgi:AcrR family transcriptional regulator
MTAGLRERKKLDTRHAIATAALRLAIERGPDAVTIDEISRLADVSTRTFFNYFASKEDAILNVYDDLLRDLHDLVLARPADESPLDALKNAMLETSGDLRLKSEESALRRQVIHDYPALYPGYVAAFARFESQLAEAIAVRTGLDPTCELYPEVLVAAAVAVMRVAVSRLQADETTVDPTTVIERGFQLLASGLALPAPKRRG